MRREIDAPIDADRVGPGLRNNAGMAVEARAAGEHDDLRLRNLSPDAFDHAGDGAEGEALERIAVGRLGQNAGMGLEDLHRIVNTVREHCDAPVILGGAALAALVLAGYSPRAILARRRAAA